MKHKLTAALATVFGVVSLAAPLASAHVTVSPNAAVPAERVTFSVGVPNEKEVPVTAVRLTVPGGLASVTPTIEPGWTIETEKDGDKVRSITWSGGEIPVGQRGEFSFRTQTPAEATELQWKAYQTYADGTTVAWDQSPSADGHGQEGGDKGPYSVTKVSETAGVAPVASASANSQDWTSTLALAASLLALILSAYAVSRKKTATK